MEWPDVIEADIGALCRELAARGYDVTVLNVGPMHSYQVQLSGSRELIITADRGQLFVEGDQAILAPAGLWRAFDDREEFRRVVLSYALAPP